jgi:hypothetical protein
MEVSQSLTETAALHGKQRSSGDTAETMSEQDVKDLIDGVLEAMNARAVDRLMELVDPEIELYSRLIAVDGRSYKGQEGIGSWFAEVDEAFEAAHWALEEIQQAPDGDFVVVLRQTARGRSSRALLDVPSFQVWKLRNDRPWRIVVYATQEEALEAAGLSE